MIATLLTEQLAARIQQQRLRQLTTVTPVSAREISVSGARFLQFSSNDYLGLSQHPQVLAAYAAAPQAGSRASALVTGYSAQHQALADLLADVLERERVVLFSSAFAANTGALGTLGQHYQQLWLDRLSHASLLQGARQSGARWRRFRHNQLAALNDRLTQQQGPALLISESVFSMDGDSLAAEQLQTLLAAHPTLDVLLDDAHGFGVCGDRGRSVAAQFSAQQVGIVSLAFGKACGVAGGALGLDSTTADYLINFCPELIYSTAMPPAQAGAIATAVKLILAPAGEQLRQRLWQNVAQFQQQCAAQGLPVSQNKHPIQTLVVGSDATALAMSASLRQQGIWCSAIRPPTVPEGTARLRLTLTAAHTEADIQQLVTALYRACQESNV
ncbi:aminotransferase class I/II-fold pyridoxal phosphate-dependent enzyme [Pseudidiomarina insulisalsae]|uniref:aminotransferase class I/II-fold pyridoxal phosphate-dependent enzyme n=1 Tax=Pseudidiomarina insulisalsae TaxID=575789 RepID=UPI001300AE20|nr:8-amino-7-oxononanoate synthase [Pseudidiomarina insulisalsae]